ncbi:MAG: YvrJ family protein [bacterium]|nr:YvrJ family protein [bacterium]
MDELTGSMLQNGFSIAVASFLLIRMDKRLEELTKAVAGLGSVMEKAIRGEN